MRGTVQSTWKAVFVALLLVGGIATHLSAANRLVVGIVPSESMTAIVGKYEPLVEYLEDMTGITMDLFVSSDYTGIVEAMRSGYVDIAYLGAFSYVLASKEAGAMAFAGLVVNGSRSYNSVIITRTDSGIVDLQGLIGRSFAFVDPASGSGYLYPLALLTAAGLDPARDFASEVFAGSHDSVILSVLNSHVDAGATAEGFLPMFLAPEEVPLIAVLGTSQPILHACFAAAPSVPAMALELVEAAFLSMHETEAGRAALASIGADMFQATCDEDYDPTREVAEILNLDLTKQR